MIFDSGIGGRAALRRAAMLAALALALGGCAGVTDRVTHLWPWKKDAAEPMQAAAPAAAAVPGTAMAPVAPAGARTAAALDTTTAEQKAAATAPVAAVSASLGRVVVSLGDVTAPGFWLRSALVSEPAPGVVKTAGGQTVQVDLLPGSGAAQLSLAAFRALGLGLTDLPQVEVSRR